MTLLRRFFELRFSRISLAAACLITLSFATGWTATAPQNDGIMAAMGLTSGELIVINPDQASKSEMAITMDGEDYIMDYAFCSTRTNDFELLVQQKNGEIVEQAAPSVSTIRGSLRGVAGSRVLGCISEDGCCVKIHMPSGENCYIEPVSQEIGVPAVAGVHVVYTENDVIPTGATCANEVNDIVNLAQAEAAAEQSLTEPPTAEAVISLQEIQLSLDADFEYFSAFGSAEATLAQLELIINIVNDQYESEVGMRNTISRVMIWTTQNDPYTSTDAGILLRQFRDFYETGPLQDKEIGVNFDLCHLFTGKSLDGSTIGIAYIGAAGGSFGYGVSQDFSPLVSMTDLVAHEFGHNWNASHCNCLNHTMNPSIRSKNDFNDQLTVPVITAFRDRSNFLTEIDTALTDDFDDGADVTEDLFEGVQIDAFQNINATTQAGEPDLVSVGSTVWFNAEAEENGTLIIDTFGSDFDTQLHVYEIDGGLARLELIDNNDDSANSTQSEVTIEVTAGTSYAIRVGGFRGSDFNGSGSEGNIVLNGEFTAAILLGDANGDGVINNQDIGSFGLALFNRAAYELMFPTLDPDEILDMNGDGVFNNFDIGGFANALGL